MGAQVVVSGSEDETAAAWCPLGLLPLVHRKCSWAQEKTPHPNSAVKKNAFGSTQTWHITLLTAHECDYRNQHSAPPAFLGIV